MSSTITQTEVIHKVPTQEFIDKDLQGKRDKFSRTSSMERLKKFNAYICSQNYYILPSLLLWLKTSQSIFQAYLERGIAFLKSMFLFFVFRDVHIKVTMDAGSKNVEEARILLRILISRAQQRALQIYINLKKKALTLAIYSSCVFVVAQFLICLSYIFGLIVPVGFVFLIGCLTYITQLVVRMNFYNMSKLTEVRKKRLVPQDHIPNKIDLRLLDRTISNINLL